MYWQIYELFISIIFEKINELLFKNKIKFEFICSMKKSKSEKIKYENIKP